MANRRHEPTKESRDKVLALAMVGTPHHLMGKIVGLDTKTLLKYYAEELEVGKAKATAQVGASLFKMATSGRNTAAAIFWMKAQAGWRERDPLLGDGPIQVFFDDPTKRPDGYGRKTRPGK